MGGIVSKWHLLLGLLGAATAAAQPTMGEALTTVHLLSGFVETRLVRLDVPASDPDPPAKLYSVVLAFDHAWWLYTPGLGTCLLGPAPGDGSLTTAEITTRLRRFAPTLDRVEVLARVTSPATRPSQTMLRNGCFASCLLHLIELYARGESVEEAGVVFLSGATDGAPRFAAALGEIGHSLLVYRIAGRWRLLDPTHMSEVLSVRPPLIGVEIDPELVDYARRAHYPVGHVQYLRFSAAALDRLASNVDWRFRSPLRLPGLER